MKRLLLMLMLLMPGTILLAQQLRVSGKVADANGKGIEGVSVTVKGTKTGTTTNSAGDFSINAAKDATLVFSSVGFATKEVTVTGSSLEVTLQPTAGDLGEVVVVGYGTQKRANITSAVATVKGDQLIKRPLASTSMSLQGFAPGVVIQQSSGQPGADNGRINIRGIGSITGSSSPLIIVDGVEGANLNDVDANIIDNITILKDAASTAVYGVRGTNGVIIIKTKRGQVGKTSVAFNSFVSKQVPTNFPELLSSVEHMELMNEYMANAGGAAPFSQATIDLYKTSPANNMTVFNTDWKDLIFQNNGVMQNHNLVVSGGSDKASFLASGTYLNQQGLVTNNWFKKYDLRLNGDVNITKKIKFTSDLFYTRSTNLQPGGMAPVEIIQRGISMARIFPGKFGNEMYGDAGQSNRINPVGAAESSGYNKAETPTISARFAVTAEVFRNFILEASYNTRSSFTEAYVAKGSYDVYNPNPATNSYVFAQVIGDSALSYTNFRNNTNQYYVSGTYSYVLKDNHQFKLQGGFQALDNFSSAVGATRQGLPDPDRPYLNLATNTSVQPSVSGSASEFALSGFFGRFNYAFNQKYLFEFTGRYDGSSRFSQIRNKQWGFFPGASAGWVITKENFMEKLPFINYAKLRVSYGELGNQEVGDNYPFVATITGGSAYYFGNLLTAGASLNGIPNETISWETSKQTNVGIDLALLKNKLSITFDVYKKKVEDNIIDFPVATALGYTSSSTIPANAASFVNNGWEFSATYRNKIGKLNYSVTGNLSDVKSKVLDTKGRDIVGSSFQVTREGYSLYSYYVLQTNGLYQAGDNFASPYNGTRTTGAGDIRYRDIDGNDTINAKDRVLMGNNFPRYDYSLNIAADYKGFDFNIYLFGVGKRDNYISGVAVQPFNAGNWIASGLVSARDRWTTGKTNAAYPRLYNGGNGNYVGSDFWLRNGAFMRIKHITLGYSLPANWLKKLHLSQLRFYVNTVNPFTFSNYEPGFDPEVSNTAGSFYPIMKTTTVGVNLKF
ncbi:MAG TPA: TonB-dependent receptor [Chitinophagaceae bacterium]|nr:TonB-dependent receptor [Chitinophagaceae bacterium]